MTPAQAYGHPNFVDDVPVQGPTDEGLRAASCWWKQYRIPQKPACVNCNGPVPQWATNTLCPGNRLTNSGVGAPGDPDVFSLLTPGQQAWVISTLIALNAKIVQSTGSSCTMWADPTAASFSGAVNCFQIWYNANQATASSAKLRTDGVLDAATACALIHFAEGSTDFPIKFPAASQPDPWLFCRGSISDPATMLASSVAQPTPTPAPAPVPAPAPAPTPTPQPTTQTVTPPAQTGLSTGAKVGIAAAGTAALAGIIFAATRGGSRRRR